MSVFREINIYVINPTLITGYALSEVVEVVNDFPQNRFRYKWSREMQNKI